MNYKLIQIHHPSGRLYEAFQHFSYDCPGASFFQSDSFIHLLKNCPETEFLLFVVAKEEALTDPGTRMPLRKSADAALNNNQTPELTANGRAPSKHIMPNSIAGSMLAVITHNTSNQPPVFNILNKLMKNAGQVTIVYGTPLLAQNTRLQKEIVLKMLLKALHNQVHKRTNATVFLNSFDHQEYLPVFRGLGYKHYEQDIRVVEIPCGEETGAERSDGFRHRVNESLENGAEVINEPDESRLSDFFQLLNKQNTENGSAGLPWSRLISVLKVVNKTNGKGGHAMTKEGVVFLVSYCGSIIGGIVCVILPKRAMHLVCACVSQDYDNRVYPETLMLWAAIGYASENSIPYFSLYARGQAEDVFNIDELYKEFGGKLVTTGSYRRVNKLLGHLIAP